MNSFEKIRLAMLSTSPYCSLDYLAGYYGIMHDDDDLFGRFRSWTHRFMPNAMPEQPGTVNRYAFESYLQKNKLLSLRWAACRLGMDEKSFDEVLTALDAQSLMPGVMSHVSEQVINEPFVRSFYTLFPKLTNYTFGDHRDYCQQLHREIEQDLNIKVRPVYCATSVAASETPADYGHDFDCITFQPIGIKYQVWLDFEKPMYLSPDRCGSAFYVQNESLLKKFKFPGDEPRLPTTLAPETA